MSRFIKVSLGFSMGKNAFSRAISALDSIGGRPSMWSHVFWHFEFESAPAILYESCVGYGVAVTPYDYIQKKIASGHFERFHLEELVLTAHTAERLLAACIETHAKPYDKLHLLGLLAWIKFHRRSEPRRPFWLRWAANEKYICSEFTEHTARKAGLDLCGKDSTPVTTTPHSQWLLIRGASADPRLADTQRVLVD